MCRVHPARWEFGDQRIDSTGLHLGDVGLVADKPFDKTLTFALE
jgi:hypothetical protein